MKKPVLVIDDHKPIGRLFGMFLKQTSYADHQMIFIETVEEACVALRTLEPVAIFLDNYLPPHVSFHEPLRQLLAVTDLPIMLMTGSDLDELGHTDIPDGFTGYLSKSAMTPAAIEQLISDAILITGLDQAEQIKRA